MKVHNCFDGEYELTYKQIEEKVRMAKRENPHHDFEIQIDESNGTLDLWLDDHIMEIHILEITPTKEDLKLIDEKGICGTYPSRNLRCPLGLGSYDWVLSRKTCDCCRKCFNFKL